MVTASEAIYAFSIGITPYIVKKKGDSETRAVSIGDPPSTKAA